MTHVLRLIRRQLQLNATEFFVPFRDMEAIDWQLFDYGVLEYRKDFLQQSVCPECGGPADVLRTTENGEEVTCVHCEICRYLGWQKIDAKEVDLLTFSYRTFLQYINDATVKGEYVEAAARCIPANGIETLDRKSGKKRSAGRKGVGGKGPQTVMMKTQYRTFKTFLTASHYDGDLKKINSLAAQCWAKNKAKWDKAVTASGQQKGYSSPKVLANAYRNSK